MPKLITNEVKGCGNINRTIYRVDDICKIGCFTGTREEAEKRIRNEYEGDNRKTYLAKIAELFEGGLEVKDITEETLEVRLTAAFRGNCHDVLHKDKDWLVRKVVAKRGGYLDILKNDEDEDVRKVARTKLKELKDAEGNSK